MFEKLFLALTQQGLDSCDICQTTYNPKPLPCILSPSSPCPSLLMEDNYLEVSGADVMIRAMMEELRNSRPANPAAFMVQFLQNNYIKKETPKIRKLCAINDTDEDEMALEEEEMEELAELSSPELLLSTPEFERPSHYIVVPDSLKRKRRGAICCDLPSLSYRPEFMQVPKSSETRAGLEKALEKNVMFSHLERDQLSQIFSAMFEVKYNASDIVYRQGDEGDNFYVVEKGECDVYAIKAGISQHVDAYMSGSAFGELALIYDSPRTSTVKAKTDVILWAINRGAFRSIVMETTMKARKIYESFLEKVPILAHLTKTERATVADSLTTEQYWDGEVIFNQNDSGDKFYIIVEGSVEISKDKEPVGTLATSQYFGEIALLTNRPRSATVVARGNTKCVYLDRGSFNRLLGPIEDILRRNMEMYNLYISSNV